MAVRTCKLPTWTDWLPKEPVSPISTPEQKAAHIDIADWIIYQIRESRINCTADHLVEAERILQRMIEKNPALQKLIDDLGLVVVGASSIGSGDGNPP